MHTAHRCIHGQQQLLKQATHNHLHAAVQGNNPQQPLDDQQLTQPNCSHTQLLTNTANKPTRGCDAWCWCYLCSNRPLMQSTTTKQTLDHHKQPRLVPSAHV